MATIRIARGEPTRRSQKRSRKPEPRNTAPEHVFRPGQIVRWRDHIGVFVKDYGGGFAEVEFEGRRWRLPIIQLG